MAGKPASITQGAITRALRSAKAAGIAVARIKIAADGSIEIYTATAKVDEPSEAFDAWKASNAHQA